MVTQQAMTEDQPVQDSQVITEDQPVQDTPETTKATKKAAKKVTA